MTSLDELLKMLNSYEGPRPHKGILCEVCKTPIAEVRSYSIRSGDALHPANYVACGNQACHELIHKRHNLNRIELSDQMRRQAIANHQARIDAENKASALRAHGCKSTSKTIGDITMSNFEKVIEDICGEPIDVIRNRSLNEQRRRTETKYRKPMKVMDYPDFLTTEKIDEMLDQILPPLNRKDCLGVSMQMIERASVKGAKIKPAQYKIFVKD